MKHLGAMVTVGDEQTYHPELMSGMLIYPLFSTTPLFSRQYPAQRDNSGHATSEGAAAIVRALNGYYGGGYSVGVPSKGYGGGGFRAFGYVEWFTYNSDGVPQPAPQQMITCPDGEDRPAGPVLFILGNEAAYGSVIQRDEAIQDHLKIAHGRFGFLSEAILTALGV